MMKTIQTPRGPYRYKPVYLYVGRKVIDRDVATENLRDLVPVLEAAGIHFGPIFGSLLGMVRTRISTCISSRKRKSGSRMSCGLFASRVLSWSDMTSGGSIP